MQLYGSDTSPFARRLRMMCMQQNLNVTYEHIDIFSAEGRKKLLSLSPVAKIPFLVDGEQVVLDSNVVFDYLCQKHNIAPLGWDERNQLTTINAANDSAVELLICARSGFDTSEQRLFFDLQKQRIAQCLSALNQQVESMQNEYVLISLFCLVDWLLFRELEDLTPYPALAVFHQHYQQTPWAQHTDPRQG
ncbi:glutathione S-transferase family protein [Pseudoalteromonas sp. SSDWG2]|uniref:glutathione S-transferase family protein n=1 Tax=Pseudoalteromonas sp. SSDWG2 TaxID=3139391 RepID=UPI003BA86DAA